MKVIQDVCLALVAAVCISAIAKTTNFDPIKDSKPLIQSAITEFKQLQKQESIPDDAIPYDDGEPSK